MVYQQPSNHRHTWNWDRYEDGRIQPVVLDLQRKISYFILLYHHHIPDDSGGSLSLNPPGFIYEAHGFPLPRGHRFDCRILQENDGLQDVQIFRMSQGMIDPRVICLRLHIPWTRHGQRNQKKDTQLEERNLVKHSNTCHGQIEVFVNNISAAVNSSRIMSTRYSCPI